MSQPTSIIDCRGLSAPLTVLRIKQAVIGRSDVGLPLDVLVDRTCCDGARVSECLTGESTDVRLLYLTSDDEHAAPVRETVTGEPRHV
ncbi:hypothetical protein [Pseudoruegeria sp. HB172150]|uniref:hypothetical protein n=1 Tax=Pseudoruegeria sp. HB172150 TaxID=2721164 RepID=UPI001553582E|nr:hypothetical protein [Pseudoruegeria sp. HB172150]